MAADQSDQDIFEREEEKTESPNQKVSENPSIKNQEPFCQSESGDIIPAI